MISLPTTTTDMAVIDSDRAGYEALAGGHPSSLHFRSSGGEALRLAATERIAVWWIAVDLRDMSGFDLHDMLRERLDGAEVYMVGETYRVEHNLLARRAGVAMYVCKPVHPCWLPPSVRAAHAEPVESRRPEAAVNLPRPTCDSLGPRVMPRSPSFDLNTNLTGETLVKHPTKSRFHRSQTRGDPDTAAAGDQVGRPPSAWHAQASVDGSDVTSLGRMNHDF